MLTTKKLTTLQPKDDDSARLQNNISAALNPLLQTPILDGVLLTNLTIPASGKLVAAHGLGRTALGYMVVFSSAAVPAPYALPADQTSPANAIMLTFSSGAGAKINLWCF